MRSAFLLWFGLMVGGTAACSPGNGIDKGLTHDDAGGAGGTGNSGGSGNGTGSGASNGSGGITVTGGTSGTAGDSSMLECTPPEGPYCGDGMVNQPSEKCDDGNTSPGDGCTGVCAVEPYFTCPGEGGKCASTLRCGDGARSPGEACDDGNAADGDGCAHDCASVDPGYYCPTPGQPCLRSVGACGDSKVQPGETCDDGNTADGDGCSGQCRVEAGYRCTQPGKPCIMVAICGNGLKEGGEECDDNNANSGDGCSSTCHVEIGWLCDAGPGKPCRTTKCGDGKKEGSECCDDGNLASGDGCNAACLCEPTCPAIGPCTAKCGNGIVEGTEACDDGNIASGDGCSATCTVEAGFACKSPPCTEVNGQCVLVVPATFRDFNAHDATGGHPDFQPGFQSSGAIQGLVLDTLDADGKPQLSANANANSTGGFMHGQSAFAQWYRNDPPSSGPIPGQLVLYDNGSGGFVNRWGANGEPWLGYPQGMFNGETYPNAAQCSGTDCTACGDPPTSINGTPAPAGSQIVCLDDCFPWGANQTQACFAAQVSFDGNPLFFPLDTAKGILSETRKEAKVPEQYGWVGWPWEPDVGAALNLATPIQTSTAPFPSATHNFSFTTEVKYWFKYDAKTPATLDFTGDDDVWVFLNGHLAVDLGGWHVPLNGTLTINGATVNATTQVSYQPAMSTSKPGTATAYGLVDGNVYQIQIFHAEREVEGSSFKLTLAGFSMVPSECTETCGDGIVTVSEECDDGPMNSDEACGACTTQCKFGARCGNGITEDACGEQCDDGVNVGGYNQCDVGCKQGPRCGDGVTQADFGEQCDDGANNGTSGACTANCGVPGFCGDGVVQAPETCDNGVNDNSYGGCSPDCQFGPRCGDGVVQADAGETCDLADMNSDAYGGCTTQCHTGPHCGDGVVQAPEQCDPGDGSMLPAAPMSGAADPACTSLNSTCTSECRVKVITR